MALEWRQGHGIDPFREWGRRVLSSPRDGMVLIDLDIAVRRYGSKYNLDYNEGDLMLIEKKEQKGSVTHGQKRVYGWLLKRLRKYDTFRGCHLLRVVYTSDAPLCPTCGQPSLSSEEAYQRFLAARLYWDNEEVNHAHLAEILEGENKC